MAYWFAVQDGRMLSICSEPLIGILSVFARIKSVGNMFNIPALVPLVRMPAYQAVHALIVGDYLTVRIDLAGSHRYRCTGLACFQRCVLKLYKIKMVIKETAAV